MFTEMRLERRLERLELEEQRITERLAIVTIVALVLSVAGAATAAAGAERSAVARALAAVTLAAGAGAGAQSWRLRRRLGGLRGRKAEVQSAIEARDEEPFIAGSRSPAWRHARSGSARSSGRCTSSATRPSRSARSRRTSRARSPRPEG